MTTRTGGQAVSRPHRPHRPTVLHVLEALGTGTARHLVDVVEWTPGVTHVVAVPRERAGFYTDPAALQRLRAAGADVRLVDMRRFPGHVANAAAVGRLAGIRREVRADVVHGHSAVGGALARLVPGRAARVYTPNGLHPARAAMTVERMLGPRTDRFVAVSASEADMIVAAGLAGPERVTVIANGVDPDARPAPIDLHRMLGLPEHTPLVGTIARLEPQKAPEYHLEVFAGVARVAADAHFVVIGEGSLAAEVDRLAADGPLAGRFHRIPSLPGAAAALGSLRVFVLLSRYEGGPYAPLEAARAGVPLVLSDVVGNRDVVVAGASGELVALGDVAAAVSAVVGLLDDDARRARMVEAMRRRLTEEFTLRRNGLAHEALYRQLAAGVAGVPVAAYPEDGLSLADADPAAPVAR